MVCSCSRPPLWVKAPSNTGGFVHYPAPTQGYHVVSVAFSRSKVNMVKAVKKPRTAAEQRIQDRLKAEKKLRKHTSSTGNRQK